MVADNQKGFAAFLVGILFRKLAVLILREIELVFVSVYFDRRSVSHENTLMVKFRLISESFFSPLAEGKKLNIYSSILCKNYFNWASSVRHIYLFSRSMTPRIR